MSLEHVVYITTTKYLRQPPYKIVTKSMTKLKCDPQADANHYQKLKSVVIPPTSNIMASTNNKLEYIQSKTKREMVSSQHNTTQ